MTHHTYANLRPIASPHAADPEAWRDIPSREFLLFSMLHGMCHWGEIDTERVSGADIRSALEHEPDGLLAACFDKFPDVDTALQCLVDRGVLVPLPGRLPPNEVYHVLMPIADREAQS